MPSRLRLGSTEGRRRVDEDTEVQSLAPLEEPSSSASLLGHHPIPLLRQSFESFRLTGRPECIPQAMDGFALFVLRESHCQSKRRFGTTCEGLVGGDATLLKP